MKTLLRLLAFLRPFTGEALLSVLLSAATVAAGIGLLGTSADLIARAALRPSIAELQVAIVGVRFFGISRAALRYLERLTTHSVNFRLLAELRVWFYRALEPLAPARLWQFGSGDLLSRAVADIETLENFYVRVVSPLAAAGLVTLGLGLFVGRFDAGLGWTLVLGMLVAGAGVPIFGYLVSRSAGQAVVEWRAALNTQAVETLQGLSDLLAYNADRTALAALAEQGRGMGRAQERLARRGGLANAAGLLVSLLTLFAVLWQGIPLVRGGEIAGALLPVLVLLALAGFEAVSGLPQAAQQLGSSQRAAERLFQLVDAQPAVREPDVLCHPAGAAIQARGLGFTYPGASEPALAGIDFDLPAGKRVAIVGPSGAGKSTLLYLLARFYPYNAGSLTLGGCELAAVSGAEARRMIAVGLQGGYLFSATLRQNLLLAYPSASPERLQSALEIVGLSEWAVRLPEGLDTRVGERGTRVSGGERQRLALARALLQPGPVLALDEPTAHLDTLTETEVIQRLLDGLGGRSLIWVTHRLVAMERMDEILVLDRGRIVERGQHAGLVAQGGLYARLWAAQRRALPEGESKRSAG
jgi:ATP-binding cassette subfamily C protein CydC